MQRLDVHVQRVYGPLLQELDMKHIEYLVDEQHFGNQLDRYANEHIRLQFVDDRGEEFIQLFSTHHPEDLFALPYLAALLAPETLHDSSRASLETLVDLRDRVYGLFESKHYACYRKAYRLYESCRNEEQLNK